MFGDGGFGGYDFSGAGMHKPQFPGVEGLAGQVDTDFGAAGAVGAIAHHGMAHIGAMDPNLMGPSGLELKPHQRKIPQTFLYKPMGDGVAASFFFGDDRLPLAIIGIARRYLLAANAVEDQAVAWTRKLVDQRPFERDFENRQTGALIVGD